MSKSKKYSVIYADPPWPSPGGFAPNATYPADFHYPCMKIDEIAALPIQSMLEDDAALFL